MSSSELDAIAKIIAMAFLCSGAGAYFAVWLICKLLSAPLEEFPEPAETDAGKRRQEIIVRRDEL